MHPSGGVRAGLLIALACLLFTLGLVFGRSFEVFLASDPLHLADVTPNTVRHTSAPEVSSPTDLKPLATFWEVRDKIKRNFVYPIDDDTKLTYGAIRGMVESLDDPYSRFMTPDENKDFESESEGHFSGIGAVLDRRKNTDTDEWEVVISAIIPEGPAAKTPLRAEDVLLGVDAKSVQGAALQKVVTLIRGEAGTTVKLTIKRKGEAKPIEIPITRGDVEVPSVEHAMLPGNIGYIWLRSFNRQSPARMRQAIEDLKKQGMKAMLLDLSLDPGGLLDAAVEIASLYVKEGPVVWIRERGAEPEPLMARKNSDVPADLPIVCLVDSGSASASEILAGCLQDYGRATIVGQHSFGKSKVQTVIELNDSSALVLTTAIYLTPHKRDIGLEWAKGKKGVKPDVEFEEPKPDSQDTYEKWHDGEKAKALDVLRQHMAVKPAG